MPLSDREIIEMQDLHNLITPFVGKNVKEGNKPSYGLQPHGYDLRLSSEFGIVNSGGINSSIMDVKTEFYKEESDSILVPPHSYIVVRTIEKLNMPANLVGIIRPKSTYIRKGLSFFTAVVDAGFSGRLEFGLYNFNPFAVSIPIGAGIVQIAFFKAEESLSDYKEKGGVYGDV